MTTNTLEHNIEERHNNLQQEADRMSISSRESTLTACDLEQQLPKEAKKEEEEPYCKFSKNKKLLTIIICCLTGIISPLSANAYFPALNAIQEELHTTTELVNLTVTVYMIFQGLSPSFWGSLADVWGRRPVYLCTLLVYMGSCVGLALAPVYWVLLVLRMLQAFGSSSVIAIGAGVVGDIAVPSERGGYFGLFSMGQMLGTVVGPVLGGIIAEQLSWRWIFWILLIIGSTFFLAILFFLPETLRALVGNGSIVANPTPFQLYAQYKKEHQEYTDDDSSTLAHVQPLDMSRFLHIPNISQPFLYLLQKDVFVALVYNGIHYATYYAYLTSTTSQFSLVYGLSQLQIGLCFLCQGVGCIIGSFIQGKLLDRDFRRFTKVVDGVLPKDFPIFKARLRSVYHNAGLIGGISLFYGWMLHIHAPLAVILVLQFFVGFANTSMFNTFQTLMVDLFPGKSASITATNNLVRCLLGAVATVTIEPGIRGVGVGWIFTILGLICLASNALLPVLLIWGPQWRIKRESARTCP